MLSNYIKTMLGTEDKSASIKFRPIAVNAMSTHFYSTRKMNWEQILAWNNSDLLTRDSPLKSHGGHRSAYSCYKGCMMEYPEFLTTGFDRDKNTAERKPHSFSNEEFYLPQPIRIMQIWRYWRPNTFIKNLAHVVAILDLKRASTIIMCQVFHKCKWSWNTAQRC